MPSLLLLGASSLVGRSVAPRLLSSGFTLHGVGRELAPLDFPTLAQWHTADVCSSADLRSLPDCDVIVSLLPIWIVPSALGANQGDPTKRIVVFSSTSVLTKSDSADPGERALAELLKRGEAGVRRLASGPRTTIVRPTLIYGGATDGNVTRISTMIRRTRIFPLIGDGRGLRQPVHANDLAVAISQILDHPKTEGEIYELGGGEILTYREMILRIAAANGLSVRFVAIPMGVARVGARIAGGIPGLPSVSPEVLTRMSTNMTFESSRANRDFGYSPGLFRPQASGTLSV